MGDLQELAQAMHDRLEELNTANATIRDLSRHNADLEETLKQMQAAALEASKCAGPSGGGYNIAATVDFLADLAGAEVKEFLRWHATNVPTAGEWMVEFTTFKFFEEFEAHCHVGLHSEGHSVLVDLLKKIVAKARTITSKMQQDVRDHYTAQAMNSVFSAVDSTYQSTMTLLAQITVFAISGSALCSDIVSHLGGRGATHNSLFNTIGEAAEAWNNDFRLAMVTSDIIMTGDNAGFYKMGTNRVQASAVNPVTTLLNCSHSLPDDPGQQTLQSQVKHSPISFKSLQDCPKDVNHLTAEHKDLLMQEVLGFAYERAVMLASNEPRCLAGEDGDQDGDDLPVDEAAAAAEDEDAAAAPGAVMLWQCNTCKNNFPNIRKSVCQFCDAKSSPDQDAFTWIGPAKPDGLKTDLAYRVSLQRMSKCFTKVDQFSCLEDGKVKVTETALAGGAAGGDAGKAEDYGPEETLRRGFQGYSFLEWCPNVAVNPVGDAALKIVYGNMQKLAGQRQWLFCAADAGFHCSKLVDEPASGYGDIHLLIGEGHELMTIVKDIIAAYWSQGGSELASLCDFKSPQAQKMVQEGGNNHKMKQLFLEIWRPAMTDMFLLEWERAEKGKEGFDLTDVVKFHDWGNTVCASGADKHFENQWFTWMYIVPAFAMAWKSFPLNNYRMYECARHIFFNFYGAMGNQVYIKAIARDMCIHNFRCTPEVKAFREKHHAYAGQPKDFVMENGVYTWKSVTSTATRKGHLLGAYLLAKAKSFRATLLGQLGMANRSRDPMDKATPKDCGLYIQRIRRLLWTKHSLAPVVSRPKVINLDLTTPAHIGLSEVYVHGEHASAQYLADYIDGLKPTCPLKVVLAEEDVAV